MRRNSGMSLITALAAGAIATYFLDTHQGRRRRAVARDVIANRLRRLNDARRVAALDARNRLQGALGALRGRLAPQREVADDVLAARVRSRLGRAVSHPGALEVRADSGVVILQGPILRSEVPAAMRAASTTRGALHVVDELQVHEHAGGVPALQGGTPRSANGGLDVPDIAQSHWAPATRFFVGVGGATLALRALTRRGLTSPLLLAGAAALLARATTNRNLGELVRGDGRGIEFSRILHFDVPVERLYAFWSDFENFPRFMRNVRSVRRNPDGTWRWEAAGPLGATLAWNSRVTEQLANERISWQTAPGSSVQHAGRVRFEPEGHGTRVHIRMSYRPVAGALGHAVATLFGADPQTEMDQDLMRLKGLFQSGKPAHDAASPEPGQARLP
jgi:uncharacterized membrane protein